MLPIRHRKVSPQIYFKRAISWSKRVGKFLLWMMEEEEEEEEGVDERTGVDGLEY